MRRALAVMGACVMATAGLFAQTVPVTTTVDVASVKRRDPADWTNINVANRPGGTVVASNFPLPGLISLAYRVQRSQVVGLPDWVVDAEKYDIVAKSVDGIGGGEAMAATLRAVLEERFALKTHREIRQMPVMALVAMRAGAPGPRLRPSPVTCIAGPITAAEATKDTRPRCELELPPGRIIGTGIDMRLLASSLGTLISRVVVDKTGFTGGFDVDVEYVPQGRAQGQPTGGDGPPLLTAIQEQLGLHLESDRADVEVIVVDRIERPTEN